MTSEDISLLVERFASSVRLQNEAILAGDASLGNGYAKGYLDAWKALRLRGDAGREGLKSLFSHPNRSVRIMAATFLLSHCEEQARAVLRAEADAGDFEGFSAEQALQRWEEDPNGLDE